MKTSEQLQSNSVTIERKNFDLLFASLIKRGYLIVGPSVKDGAISYDFITSSGELPEGWTERQSAGAYRLEKRNDKALFGFNSTAQSWKKFVHPPSQDLWHAKNEGGKTVFTPEALDKQKVAFLGVRSCDLHALGVLDKVFLGSPFTDSAFKSRRSNLLIIGVNCGQAGGTCFCASTGTGPGITAGYDILLTEMIEKNRHYFVAEKGTTLGGEIMKEIPGAEANIYEIEGAEKIVEKTSSEMAKKVDLTGVKELLFRNSDNQRWQRTAQRCLTCGNCTMVCPTCFCTTVEDWTDLSGKEGTRKRKWDSCFTIDFSYIHGGAVRPSVYSRYRQWLTHKFSSWHDQFGSSGCVGCGRCITWCPVGIDVTEEIEAIRLSDKNISTTISSKENK